MADHPDDISARSEGERAADAAWIGFAAGDRPAGTVGAAASDLREAAACDRGVAALADSGRAELAAVADSGAEVNVVPPATDGEEIPAAEPVTGSGHEGRPPSRRGHLRVVPDLVEADEGEEPPVVADTEPAAEVVSPDVEPPSPVPVVLPAPRRRRREIVAGLGSLLLTAVVGTAVAFGVDVLVGRADGLPPAYLLVFLALPTWDLLPTKLLPRLSVMVVAVAATTACWLGIAAIPVARWTGMPTGVWQGELSFGLACLIGGALHLTTRTLLRRLRPA